MLRDHLFRAHAGRDGDFRWRGDGVSRIEGLSDAVFGFAVTLLVVTYGFGVPPQWSGLIAGWAYFLIWPAQSIAGRMLDRRKLALSAEQNVPTAADPAVDAPATA